MDVIIEKASPRLPGAVRLLEQSDAYMAALYPAESNHMVDLAALEVADVTFLVARRGDEILGCCALVPAGDGTAEIKRMFVDPEARGLSLGRRMLEQVEQEARRAGIVAIRLETGIHQPEAIGLYRRSGYVEIGPFAGYSADPLSLFMEKRLV